jgi:hypothetical protein
MLRVGALVGAVTDKGLGFPRFPGFFPFSLKDLVWRKYIVKNYYINMVKLPDSLPLLLFIE